MFVRAGAVLIGSIYEKSRTTTPVSRGCKFSFLQPIKKLKLLCLNECERSVAVDFILDPTGIHDASPLTSKEPMN